MIVKSPFVKTSPANATPPRPVPKPVGDCNESVYAATGSIFALTLGGASTIPTPETNVMLEPVNAVGANVGDSNSPVIVDVPPPSTPELTVNVSTLNRSTRYGPGAGRGGAKNAFETCQLVDRPVDAIELGLTSWPLRSASYDVHNDTVLTTSPKVSLEAV